MSTWPLPGADPPTGDEVYGRLDLRQTPISEGIHPSVSSACHLSELYCLFVESPEYPIRSGHALHARRAAVYLSQVLLLGGGCDTTQATTK